mmetsp:Transcript_32716/g.103555  ORF Transcript_32716/g.103555 Transcript_32716/m.103555 type:complete len:115 (-) Transcript_32716:129-473(-)
MSCERKSHEEVKKHLGLAGAVVVDLRGNAEVASDPLVAGAIHVPATPDNAAAMIESAVKGGSIPSDPNTPIVLNCRSGRRAGIACQKLMELGYVNAINAGTIDDIRQAFASMAQ